MTTANDKLPATAAKVIASIHSYQRRFKKERGSKALANLVADAYVLIGAIWSKLSDDEQAQVLDQHGIAAAAEGTSQYTPWIKLVWGEPHQTESFIDSDCVERPLWVPDRSMEIYHHTMEELEHLGINENHADAIMGLGGAAAMAKKRKERLSNERKPARQAEKEQKRKVFLEETPARDILVPCELSSAGEFFTVLCRKVSGSQVVTLGIAESKATAILDRIAAERYDELRQAAEKRKQAERREAEIQKRVDVAREEERRLLVTANPQMLSQLRTELTGATAATKG